MTRSARFSLIAVVVALVIGGIAALGVAGRMAWTTITQPPPQVALTQETVDGLIEVEREVAGLSKKMPTGNDGVLQGAKQAFEVARRMADIGKRHGFDDTESFRAVATSWQLVQNGIDPRTRTYLGPDYIRRRIAALEADTQLPEAKRTKALELYRGQLAEALAAGPPLPGNVALVTKNYGRMLDAVNAVGGK